MVQRLVNILVGVVVVSIGCAITGIVMMISAGKYQQACLSELSYARSSSDTTHAANGPIVSCRQGEFPCAEKCLDLSKRCDGIRDCLDGSDEECDNLPQSRHKTLYMANSNSCNVPPIPRNGKYASAYHTTPDGSVNVMELNVTCNTGYELLGSPVATCSNAEWTVPECIPLCKLEPHIAIAYYCIVPNTTNPVKERPCKLYEPSDTMVRPECKKPNYYPPDILTFMRCVDGKWDSKPKCNPECGTITPHGTKQMVGGAPAQKGELPWHTGIYDKTYSPYKQICGGSLIRNNMVVSAAHCFYVTKPQPPSAFAVAVGKLYRPYTDRMDDQNGAQRSDVKDIKIPDHFRGRATNYQGDIALVILSQPFVYEVYVKPVCLDLDNDFERRQLVTGKMGKVAGWGLHDIQGTEGSPVLKVAELPYIPAGDCIDKAPPFFEEYITLDKMCAGYENNGTAVCQGDSGGGLVFAAKERNVQRYYLRGVASTAPDNGNQCNDKTFSAFTQVIHHAFFILEHLTNANQWRCGDGTCIALSSKCDGFEDCPDKSDEAVSLCERETTPAAACVVPPKPVVGVHEVNPPNALPGETFDVLQLNVTCPKGYGVKENSMVICYQGVWTAPIPTCSRLCKLPKHPSVHYYCQITSDGVVGRRLCKDYEVSGTVVQPECNTPNYYSTLAIPYMRCIDGLWDYQAICSPECGRISLRNELVIGGREANKGEFPWHATIYAKYTVPYKQYCGGSLVTSTMVISAAHCFFDEMTRNLRNKTDFVVAVGKLYRPYNDPRDDAEGIQKSEVKNIKVPERYLGRLNDFSDDIALVIVAKEFQFTLYVRPVCLDFDHNFEKRHLKAGNLGMMASWGPGRTLTLVVSKLPYLNTFDCIQKSPPHTVQFVTEDKFCVDHSIDNDMGICRGASGGGLVFPERERAFERYYLRGLASSMPDNDENECNNRSIIFMTQITKHERFIKQYLRSDEF